MNWQELEEDYPYSFQELRVFLKKFDMLKDAFTQKTVIKKYLGSKGFKVSIFYINTLKENEQMLRVKDEPRLQGLPLRIGKQHLINGVEDLVLKQPYLIKMGGTIHFTEARYDGMLQPKTATQNEVHGFRNSSGIRLVKKDEISIRVFKVK